MHLCGAQGPAPGGKVLGMVQALSLEDIFATTAEADAYIDKLQREMLHGDDES